MGKIKLAAVALCMLAAAVCSASTNLVHVIELEIRQESFTLNPFQHMRDAANAFSICVPTTKEFYDSVKVGDVLGDKFKTASFWTSGNIGSRKVVVKSKRVEKPDQKKRRGSK